MRIDFHSHFLPNADHGSHSAKTSLAALRNARAAGVDRIVATPHFYPNNDTVESFLARRDAAEAHLLDALRESGDGELPDMAVGAEVLICRGMERLPGLFDLCIRGTNVLLLELPFHQFSEEYVDTACEFIKMGLTIVLAHCDRYSPENIEKMRKVGCKIQLNADSLAKILVAKHLRRWVAEGAVVAIGSDVHGSDDKYYKDFARACRKLGVALDPIMRETDALLKTAVFQTLSGERR